MDAQLKRDIANLHAQICSALSSPTRILVLCLLSDGPRNVSELTAELELPQSTISRHLKILEDKKLVYAQRRGQFIDYHLADDRVIDALRILRGMVVDMLGEQAALAKVLAANDILEG